MIAPVLGLELKLTTWLSTYDWIYMIAGMLQRGFRGAAYALLLALLLFITI